MLRPALFAAVIAASLASDSSAQRSRPAAKLKLTLTAIPKIGTSTTIFTFQGRLSGGPDDESLYCLTAEWLWEEQADSSLNEEECEPFEPGRTPIQRTFTEEQSFSRPGERIVRLVLHKGDREIAATSVTVTVRNTR